MTNILIESVVASLGFMNIVVSVYVGKTLFYFFTTMNGAGILVGNGNISVPWQNP